MLNVTPLWRRPTSESWVIQRENPEVLVGHGVRVHQIRISLCGNRSLGLLKMRLLAAIMRWRSAGGVKASWTGWSISPNTNHCHEQTVQGLVRVMGSTLPIHFTKINEGKSEPLVRLPFVPAETSSVK